MLEEVSYKDKKSNTNVFDWKDLSMKCKTSPMYIKRLYWNLHLVARYAQYS